MKVSRTFFALVTVFLFMGAPAFGQTPPALNPSQDPAATVAATAEATPSPSPEIRALEEKWGIQVRGVRLSAAGSMLDFRYHVVDAEKARALMDPKSKPYLIDQSSGARFMVPSSPKIGPLRQQVKGGPIPNRTYFIIFANPAKYVKPGGRVTVVIGDFRAENLVVQ